MVAKTVAKVIVSAILIGAGQYLLKSAFNR